MTIQEFKRKIQQTMDLLPKPDRNRNRQDSYDYGYEDGKRDTLRLLLRELENY